MMSLYSIPLHILYEIGIITVEDIGIDGVGNDGRCSYLLRELPYYPVLYGRKIHPMIGDEVFVVVKSGI